MDLNNVRQVTKELMETLHTELGINRAGMYLHELIQRNSIKHSCFLLDCLLATTKQQRKETKDTGLDCLIEIIEKNLKNPTEQNTKGFFHTTIMSSIKRKKTDHLYFLLHCISESAEGFQFGEFTQN
jgi:hypothetical protein